MSIERPRAEIIRVSVDKPVYPLKDELSVQTRGAFDIAREILSNEQHSPDLQDSIFKNWDKMFSSYVDIDVGP